MAAYCIHCIEQKHNGAFNAVGPACRLSMAEMLYGCRAVTSGCVNFSWVDAEFLRDQGVVEWTDLPAWVAETGPGGGLGQWLAGDHWYIQAWYRDPAGGGAEFNLSDGAHAVVCP